MGEPVRHVIDGPAGPLVVWDHPGGPPAALLLHGIGNYGRVWDLVAAAVDGRLRLVAPDARGHGESVQPARGYAAADFVADARAIVDGLGLERIVLVGHSMGGGHAIAFTLAHPARVRRLVLVDIGPELEAAGRERSARLTEDRPASFGDAAQAEAYVRATSPGYADAVYAQRMRWLFRDAGGRLAWRAGADALREIFASGAGSRGTRAWDDLAALRCPVLVVRGTQSIYLSDATAKRMIRTVPGSRLVELQAGHNPQLDRPAELAEAIVAFAREEAA